MKPVNGGVVVLGCLRKERRETFSQRKQPLICYFYLPTASMDNISYSTVALKTSCQYKTLNEQESLRVVYAEQAWITHNGW